MRRVSILLCLLLAVLLLAAGLAWLGRDLPRWAVEGLLADAGARVELGEMIVPSPRRMVLRRLRIEAISALPMVEVLTIAEVRVEAASFRDLLGGRFERVEVQGLDARLVPATFELSDQPLPVEIAELEIEPARITAATPDGETSLVVEGILRRIGGAANGKLGFRSPRLDLAPLLALLFPTRPPRIGGRLVDLEGNLAIGRLELAVKAAAGSIETEDLRLDLPTLSLEASIAGEDRKLVASSAAIRASVGDRDVDLGAGRLEAVLTPANQPGALHFELTPELAVFAGSTITGDWHLAARRLLRLEARVDGLRLDPLLAGRGIEGSADLELTADGERLKYGATVRPTRLSAAAHAVDLRTPGATLTVAGEAPFPDLDTLAENGAAGLFAALAGPLEATLDVPAATGRWRGNEIPAAVLPLKARFTGELKAGRPDDPTVDRGTRTALDGDAWLVSAAAGRLEAAGVLAFDDAGPGAELTWHWRGPRLARLLALLDPLDRRLREALDGFLADGLLTADGSLRDLLTAPTVGARVRLRQLAATRGEAWSFDGGSVEGDLVADQRGLRLRALSVSGDLTVAPLAPIPLTLDASGRSALDLAEGQLASAVLESPGLGRLRLSGDWRPAPGGETLARGRVLAEELDVAAWQGILTPMVLEGPPPDLALGGRVEADLAAELRGADGWQLTGPLCLQDGGFSSTFGTRVMQGLAAAAELRVDGAAGAPVIARARGRAGGFLLLWDAFFGDFSQVEADVEMIGTVEAAAAGDAEPSLGLRTRVEVAHGPELAAVLERPAGGEPSYRLRLDDDDLAATHERYLRRVLIERFGDADLGGNLSARLRGGRAVDGSWTVGGDVRVTELGWTSTSGEIAVAGLDLILPLDLRLAGRGRPASDALPPTSRRRSRVRFDRLALSGLEIPATDSGLWVEGDSLSIDEPIELEILGGNLSLERLNLKRLLTPERHLETGLRLSGLRLEEISRALDLFPLEGTLEGTFPKVRLSGSDLSVEGGGEIALFGGSVRVSDISGEEIFTRFPKLTLSAELRDIDLGLLTRRIDFGEMGGVLQGSIRDCELFRGIPVRCQARFETVHREGFERTVDVKAINNLTILGTGAGAGAGFLDRGIRRFFKRYTYERLGVDVGLDQDVLSLRGLEVRGDRELFLRGRLPFPIDVVNAQPGKTVSFQTMLRRLKSLEVGGTTEPPSDGD